MGVSANLSITSYAILALLADRDWSSYELTKYFRDSLLRNCWPRAASYLYKEQKKLADNGLIKPRRSSTNVRRTIYSITEEGHCALSCWFTEPNDIEYSFQYQYASMVKFLFAHVSGDRAIYDQIRLIEQETIAEAKMIFDKLNEESRVFENSHVNVHVLRFIVDLTEFRLRWCQETLQQLALLEKLPDSIDEVEKEFLKQVARLKTIAKIQ